MKKWLKRFGILILILVVFSALGDSKNNNTAGAFFITEEVIK